MSFNTPERFGFDVPASLAPPEGDWESEEDSEPTPTRPATRPRPFQAQTSPGPARRVRFRPPHARMARSDDRFIPRRTADSPGATAKFHFKPDSSRVLPPSSIFERPADAFGPRSPLKDITPPKKQTPRTKAWNKSLTDALGVKPGALILKPSTPKRPRSHISAYDQDFPAAQPCPRQISFAPEKVLDAPDVVDDFYLNVLDWSRAEFMAIGLGYKAYLYTFNDGTVKALDVGAGIDQVTSVKFSSKYPTLLAIGTSAGNVQIWDTKACLMLRSIPVSYSRIACLAWYGPFFAAGSRSGTVAFHDIRNESSTVASFTDAHDGEVCGLAFRLDGSRLACGSNDDTASIWDTHLPARPAIRDSLQHKAAVKPLAWCPWNPKIFATGGGSSDKCINIWNSTTGEKINSVDTGCQITGLHWAQNGTKELVSCGGSGSASRDGIITIWDYPTLTRVAEWPAHSSRVLSSVLSPDGITLATISADESLKLWKVFEKKKTSQRLELR